MDTMYVHYCMFIHGFAHCIIIIVILNLMNRTNRNIFASTRFATGAFCRGIYLKKKIERANDSAFMHAAEIGGGAKKVMIN